MDFGQFTKLSLEQAANGWKHIKISGIENLKNNFMRIKYYKFTKMA